MKHSKRIELAALIAFRYSFVYQRSIIGKRTAHNNCLPRLFDFMAPFKVVSHPLFFSIIHVAQEYRI